MLEMKNVNKNRYACKYVQRIHLWLKKVCTYRNNWEKESSLDKIFKCKGSFPAPISCSI